MNNKLIWLVVIGAVLLFSEKKKTSNLSGMRQKKRKAIGDLPEEMYYLQQSTNGVMDFGDWMRGTFGLDPTVFGSMKLIELKDRLMDQVEKRRKRMQRIAKPDPLYDSLEYSNEQAEKILKSIPIYVPKLRNMTLHQVFEMAKNRDVSEPTWVRKLKTIPESKGQMTLFGGIKGMVRIEDIEKEYGKHIPKKFRENLKSYIDNPDVQSFIRKSLAYKLSDSDYKTLYKIGCHPDSKPKCKYPGLNYVTTIFIHPVTKWQVVVEKVERLEKALDREEARKPKGQMTLFGGARL